MKIIKNRKRVEVVSYGLQWDGPEGSGYSFDCDRDGVVDESALQPAGLENYRLCRAGLMEGCKGPEVQTYQHTYTDHAVGQCICGKEVTLSNYTNTCECGTDYSIAGQRLAPREQWGWDTGESVSDILSININRDC
tara:strand:- start:777 stop:1184 length:408 start_codon:yes stop_codon:yes gene_type:complete